jgi:hypothetical protein
VRAGSTCEEQEGYRNTDTLFLGRYDSMSTCEEQEGYINTDTVFLGRDDSREYL